ncbi:MAG: precorrin-6y C5,15-methyltransferase (decarboxylating) subunit CbiE [Pseudorhodobacter sp.]
MSDPWLTLIGLGEDGLDGLSHASRDALAAAEIVFGGPRHLALAGVGDRGRAWPVPFSVAPVLAARGRRVVVLASGDPFWFGAGGALVGHLAPGEWVSHPAPSTFALAANRLGWRLEETLCLGLHAAPLTLIAPHMVRERRVICLLRDGAAVADLARFLTDQGAGGSMIHALSRLGGPLATQRSAPACNWQGTPDAPVCAAFEVAATCALPATPGLPDAAFQTDGQITKSPIRALTLAALAPRPGELLWDLGAGSGSVSVEWARAGGRTLAVEAREDRAATIRANIDRFGLVGRISLLVARFGPDLPRGLTDAPLPDAVFIGGGASAALLANVWGIVPPGCRIVVNAVTLETEALLHDLHARHGGRILRIDIAEATPLGPMRGWQPSRPVVQWAATR